MTFRQVDSSNRDGAQPFLNDRMHAQSDRPVPVSGHTSCRDTPLSTHELPKLLASGDPLHWTSLLTVLVAGVAIFVMGGIVPGLNSLYPVLYVEGLFVSHCTTAQQEHCQEIAHNRSAHTIVCCGAQDEMLTLMSSVALFATDGVMLLYGELLDRKGARVCCGVALMLSWLGFVLISVNGAFWRADLLYVISFFCIGVAGPGIFMSCLSFGECYPRLQPVITALAASMWDTSSVVFLFFSEMYFAGGLPLHLITAVWLAVIVPIGTVTWSQLPSLQQLNVLRAHGDACASVRASSRGIADLVDHTGEAVRSSTSIARSISGLPWPEPIPSVESPPVGGPPPAPPPPMPAWDEHRDALPERIYEGNAAKPPSLRSLFYRADTCFLLCFMSIYNLKSSFYIVSLDPQLHVMLTPSDAQTISDTFNIAFPAGGFLFSFVSMWLLDRWHRDEHLYMGLVISLAVLFSMCNLFPNVWAQYVAIYTFGPTRTLQWAAYFLFLEQPDRYPPMFLGRLIGYGNLIIALVGDGPPTALKIYVQHGTIPATAFGRYELIHTVLTTILVGCLAFPLYLRKQSRRRRKAGGM